MRILVTGSRDWDDWITIGVALVEDAWQGRGEASSVTVIHGGSRGADWLADLAAKKMGFNTEVHLANWDDYGKAAGPIRNQEMVDAGADICLAFIKNNSRGATHCAEAAEKAGIPVRRYRA